VSGGKHIADLDRSDPVERRMYQTETGMILEECDKGWVALTNFKKHQPKIMKSKQIQQQQATYAETAASIQNSSS